MNWYFPVCHSTLSEVTLIFIHPSRLRVNFPSHIQICSEWSANPLVVSAARMMARPVWRENYKRNAPGDPFSLHGVWWCPCTDILDFVQMKSFFFSFPPYLCSIYGLGWCTWEILNGKHGDTSAICIWRDPITILDPETLTFTLTALPKLNLLSCMNQFLILSLLNPCSLKILQFSWQS